MGPRSTMLFVIFLCAMTTHLSAGMIIFKDVFTGDEMFSDIYKYKVDDDLFYEVEGKMVTRIRKVRVGHDFSLIVTKSISGVDIVLDHHLQETLFYKAQYKEYLEGYVKNLTKHLEEHKPERVAAFVASAQLAVKKILLNFDYYQFFRGETDVDREGMVALVHIRDNGVTFGFTPYMVFFKDGLKEEMTTQ